MSNCGFCNEPCQEAAEGSGYVGANYAHGECKGGLTVEQTIDAEVGPLQARIAELEAELADVRRVREVYRLVGAKRGTTIAELEAEKDALRTTYKALAKEERNELNRLEAERDEVIRYREENMRPALEHERAENTRLRRIEEAARKHERSHPFESASDLRAALEEKS